MDDTLLVSVLRIVVSMTFLGFFLFLLYKEFSFSFSSPNRRYQYRRKFQDEPEFEVAGSGFALNQSVKMVAMIPRYQGEPARQIYDSKRGVVVFDNTRY